MAAAPPVGIDLGTTYSCIAVWHNNDVRVIHNMYGNRKTPSVVGFTEDKGMAVGDHAVCQITDNPENTVFDAKRLIGKQWDDPDLQEDIKGWPFKVIRHADGPPKIQVSYQGKLKTFFPEQISAFILTNLKENAEDFLEQKVTDAVITVPAYFNGAQQQATKDAATIAGLNVLEIINEPTAAAIAYATENKITDDRNVLVYDLGGGTFDVALFNVVGNNYKVLATAGNSHLGGNDFDNNMVDFFVEQIKANQNVDISNMKRSINKLRERCEVAKRNLSLPGTPKARVIVDSLYDNTGFKGVITRNRFNEMNKCLFDSTMESVKQVLDDAKMQPHQVDHVVLAGGSTRIPYIRYLVEEFFGNKPIAFINPDEIVAKGAAILAAKPFFHASFNHTLLQGCAVQRQAGGRPHTLVVKCPNTTTTTTTKLVDSPPALKNFRLTDVNSLSLGIGSNHNRMRVVIPRHTTLPATREIVLENTNYQKSIQITVYEGESPNSTENRIVDEFNLDVEPRPAGEIQVDVSFTLNTDGILCVKAVDRMTGRDKCITTKLARLGKMELKSLLREAEGFKEEDRLFEKQPEEDISLRPVGGKGMPGMSPSLLSEIKAKLPTTASQNPSSTERYHKEDSTKTESNVPTEDRPNMAWRNKEILEKCIVAQLELAIKASKQHSVSPESMRIFTKFSDVKQGSIKLAYAFTTMAEFQNEWQTFGPVLKNTVIEGARSMHGIPDEYTLSVTFNGVDMDTFIQSSPDDGETITISMKLMLLNGATAAKPTLAEDRGAVNVDTKVMQVDAATATELTSDDGDAVKVNTESMQVDASTATEPTNAGLDSQSQATGSANESEFMNYCNCILGLREINYVLQKCLKGEITQKHSDLKETYGDSICRGVHTTIRKKDQKFKEACMDKECDVCRWLPKVLDDHKGQVYDNVTPDEMPENPWQIALIYMGQGHKKHKQPEQTDMSGVISVCNNCKSIYKWMMGPPDAIHLINQVHDIRNTLDHSASRELLNKERDDMYDTFIEFVNHPHFKPYGIDENRIREGR